MLKDLLNKTGEIRHIYKRLQKKKKENEWFFYFFFEKKIWKMSKEIKDGWKELADGRITLLSLPRHSLAAVFDTRKSKSGKDAWGCRGGENKKRWSWRSISSSNDKRWRGGGRLVDVTSDYWSTATLDLQLAEQQGRARRQGENAV